jgi:hypothetical protein
MATSAGASVADWWERMTETTDASKLKFPLTLTVSLVVGALSMAGSFWFATSGIRSDVRDIKTRMEMQAQLDGERQDNIRDALIDMKRRQELQQYEIQSLKEAITAMKGRSQ